MFLFLSLARVVAGQPLDSFIGELTKVIAAKNKFADVKQQRIDRYKAQLETARAQDAQFKLLSKLAEEYKAFIYDSAFAYAQKLQALAYEQHDTVRVAFAKNKLAFVMLSAGLFKETIDSLSHQSMRGMPDSIRIDYYLIMSRLCYDLGDYDLDHYFSPKYLALGNAYIDSALQLMPVDSYQYLYSRSLRNIKNENNDQARDDLLLLLDKYTLTEHQVAMTASTLSFYYSAHNQPEEAIRLLAKASMADIRSAVKETSAISSLAGLLYQKGDVKNAYGFVQQAMDDAVFYGARQRKVQVGSILPMIASTQLANVDDQRKRWLIYSSLITLLTILVLVFAVITFLQLKKRKKAERALMESNRIKEEYIGYYFNVNSEYVSKIEQFKKSIEMKLLTKKMDDIKYTVSSINMKKEREELYTSFDQIFLKLFPDFVTVFNSYFSDENKIVLKEGQLMNTELRIFALIRMGIHDAEKIAKILDYSVNTIYNYKARTKGRSLLSGDEFDKKIMSIHAK